MNTTDALQQLQAFRQTLVGERSGIDGKILAFDVAFKLLTDGYATDQARIDSAIQADIDARSAHIQSLTDSVATLTAEVATKTERIDNLGGQIDALVIDKLNLQDEKDALTATVSEKDATYENMVAEFETQIAEKDAEIEALKNPPVTTEPVTPE